jgi:predicted transposase YbfD/YdcC
VVVTADAMHTQREAAEFLVTRKQADYLLIVKGNQPGLHAQLKALPWRDIPVLDRTRDQGYGRVEVLTLKVATVAGLSFLHAAQAIQVTRRVRHLASRRWRAVTVYAVTSLTTIKAAPWQLAGYVRGHWAIENQLHWVRDVTFAEDASQVRAGTAPRHGHSAQPRRRRATPGRVDQHRRRAATQQPRPDPAPHPLWYPYLMKGTSRSNAGPRPAGLDGRRTIASTSTRAGQLGIALRVRSGLDFVKGADDRSGRARSRS